MNSKIYSRLTVLLLTVCVLSGCEGGNNSDAEFILKAKTATAEGNANVAVIELKSALQINPENAEARYLLGMEHARVGHWPDAESELRKARQYGAPAAKVTPPLARALYAQWKFSELLDQIVSEEDMGTELRATIHSYRSQAFLALGELNKARTEADMAEELGPELSTTVIASARLMLNQGEEEKARELLQTMVAMDPGNAEVWSLLGTIEESMGASADAETAYSKAIASSTVLSNDHLKRALVRIGLEDFEGAESDLETSQKSAPGFPGTLYAEGLLNFRQQRYAEAQTAFEKTLSAAPNHSPAMFYLGASHLAQNQLSQAEQYLANFVRLVPESPEAKQLLATTYNRQGNPNATLALLQPGSSGPDANLQEVLLLAEAHMLKNDAKSAIPLYQQAAELNFEDRGSIWMALGMAQIYAGAESSGVETLKSVTEEPFDERAKLALAYFYFNTRRLNEALGIAAELGGKDPENVGVHNFEAQIYLAQGNAGEARKSLEKALVIDENFVAASLSLAQLDTQDGALDAAKNRYQAILKGNKNSIPAMVGLADLAALTNDDTERLKWLQRASETSPGALVPHVSLVNYYLSKGDNRNALSVAQKFSSNTPDSPIALALLGEVQVKSGDKRAALATYSRLAMMAPNAINYLELAKVHSSLGDIKATQTALEKALDLEPGNTKVINSLATLEVALGNSKEAMRLALLYQQVDPESVMGKVLEGDALMSAERYKDAAAIYRDALAQQPDGRLAIKLHQAEQRSADISAADKTLLLWLNKHPDDTAATDYLALSYMRQGNVEQAIMQYESINSRDPLNASALNNLANLYHIEANPKALETAESAYKLAPENPSISDTLGWILVNQGQVKRGLSLIEKAADGGASNNPEVQYHLAYALTEAGSKDSARHIMYKLQANPIPQYLEDPVKKLNDRLIEKK